MISKKHLAFIIVYAAMLTNCTSAPYTFNSFSTEKKLKETYEKYRQVNELQSNVDAALKAGNLNDAINLYEKILVLDSTNLPAKNGIKAINQQLNHNQLVDDAMVLFNNGQFEQAKVKLRPVLIENPNHKNALSLLEKIENNLSKDLISPKKLKPALSKSVSLEFKDGNLKNIFQMISRTSGINFVFDATVRDDLRASIFVKDAPVDDAIDFLLMMHQLNKKVLTDTSLLIYPSNRSSQYEDLILRTFYLNHADAKQITSLIKQMTPIKDTYVDEKLNMITVKATYEQLRDVEKLIVSSDIPDPEVVLDVEILEIKRSKLTDIGVTLPDSVSMSGANKGLLTWKELTGAKGSNINFSPLPTINLLRQDGDTNLLANPSIRVKSREKAKIHIGDKIPIQTTTSTNGFTVGSSANYLDVGLKLEVEPRVMLNGEVSIKVSLEVSNAILAVGQTYPTVNTRNTSTVMMTADGETQILAGLINDEDRKSSKKVPGLANLPMLGRLFTDVNDSKSKTELVLLITPRVVRNILQPNANNTEFYVGPSGRSNPINFDPRSTMQQSGNTSFSPLPSAKPVIPPMPSSNLLEPPKSGPQEFKNN